MLKLPLSRILGKESTRIWGWRGVGLRGEGGVLCFILFCSCLPTLQVVRCPWQLPPSTDLPSPTRAVRTTDLNWCLAGRSGSSTRHEPCLELPRLCSAEDKNALCRPFSLPISSPQRIDAGCHAEQCNVGRVACATGAITAVMLYRLGLHGEFTDPHAIMVASITNARTLRQ